MTTNTTKNAAEATNSSRTHTNTNSDYFPTNGTPSKAIVSPTTPSLYKATNLAALAVQVDPAGVFSIQSLNTKKQIKAAMGGTAK